MYHNGLPPGRCSLGQVLWLWSLRGNRGLQSAWNQADWYLTFTLPLGSYVTLGKSLYLSEFQVVVRI